MGNVFVAKQFKKISTMIDKNGQKIEETRTEPGESQLQARMRKRAERLGLKPRT